MRSQLVSAVLIWTAAAGVARAQGPLRPAQPDSAVLQPQSSRAAAKAASKLSRRAASSRVKLAWQANGSIRSATGFASPSYPGTALEAARAFVEDNADLFGGLAIGDLEPLQTRRLGSRDYVRFEQRLEGVPVKGAHLILHVNAANAVDGVNATVHPSLERVGEWRLDSASAVERALAAHGSAASNTPTAHRLYITKDRAAHPAYRVIFRSANPPGDWMYVVSAENGRVLEKQNLRLGNHASGFAYPGNPMTTAREQVALDNLVSDRFLLSGQTKIFSYYPALKGEVEPGTVVQNARRENGNFLFNADDPRASEVQLYYGMESAGAKFRGLGFQGFREALPGVVFFQDWDAETRRFAGSDNAFFSPAAFGEGKGGMFFYLTDRKGDTTLDTDVIYHEYGHAVINDLVGPYQSPSFKALNEGSADYFSNSFLSDPVMAEYAAHLFNLRTPYLRRSDNQNAWPYNTVGESHADGNMWSGALWDLRDRLGAALADVIAINAIAMLSPDAEFFDAGEAAVIAADEIFGGYAADVTVEVMQSRGILTRAARIASEAQWLESGSSAEGSIDAASPGYVMVGDQQYRIDVPNRSTKLKVRVQGSADVRFYIRYRVPVTVEQGQIQAEQVSDTGTNPSGYLSLDNTPELQAGAYYVAVVNTTSVPVNYQVHIEVEDGDVGAGPAITFLEDGGSANGSMPKGPFLGSRQYAIRVPEGYASLAVTLEGDEDVDLYVRLGGMVYINGTGYPQADLVSNSASSREDLTVTGAGGGPLPAGVYVLGVYNYSSNTTSFQVRARLQR